MAKFFYYFIPLRKKYLIGNLHIAFGNVLTHSELEKLAKASYSHLLKSIKEMISLSFNSQKKLKKRVKIKGAEYLKNLLSTENKGVILISGHIGNWEFAPLALTLHHADLFDRICVVRKKLPNKWLEKKLFQRFNKAGLKIFPSHNAMYKTYQALKTNKAVAFVVDLHPALDPQDMQIDSLRTYPSATILAKRTNASVLFFRCIRDVDDSHIFEFFLEIPWISGKNKIDEIKLNTQQYNAIIERSVLEYPDQWMLFYNRWKKPHKYDNEILKKYGIKKLFYEFSTRTNPTT